jgi:O-antigen/teichoic acid export membrane protein
VLGVHLFGKLGLVQNLVILMGTTLGAGVYVAVSKLVAEYRDSDPDRLKTIIPMSILLSTSFGVIMFMILFLIAPWLSSTVLNIPQLQSEIKLSLFFLVFSIVNGAVLGIIAGMENFRTISLLHAFHGFSFFALSILGALVAGFAGALIGLVLSEMLSLVVNIAVTHRIFKKKYFVIDYFKLSQRDAKTMAGIAFPGIVSRIIILPPIWFTSVFLANQIGGISALGLFNASDKMRQLMLFFPITISGSILPILSNLNNKGEHKEFKKLVKYTLFMNLIICGIPLLLLLFFAAPILSLYGKDFWNGRITLQLLALSTLPNILNIVYGQVLISLGQVWKRTFFDIFLSVVMLASSFYFIPKFLDNGLALSYLLSYSAISLLMVIHYHSKLEKSAGLLTTARLETISG